MSFDRRFFVIVAACLCAGIGVGILLGLSDAPLVAATVGALLTALLAAVAALGGSNDTSQQTPVVAGLGLLVLALAVTAFHVAVWRVDHPSPSTLERQYEAYRRLLGEPEAKAAVAATVPREEAARLIALHDVVKKLVGEKEAAAAVLERIKRDDGAVTPPAALPDSAKSGSIGLTASEAASFCDDLLSSSSATQQAMLGRVLESFGHVRNLGSADVEQLGRLLCGAP